MNWFISCRSSKSLARTLPSENQRTNIWSSSDRCSDPILRIAMKIFVKFKVCALTKFTIWMQSFTISDNSFGNTLITRAYLRHGQGRIFIFGTRSYFKLGAPLEGLRWPMWYNQHHTSSLHSLNKLFQFINTSLYSEFPRYQEPEACQLPSIPPIGGRTVTRNPKFRT